MKRCWEEARRLGAALAASPYTGRELAADLRELDKQLEPYASPEEEALHVLIDGLVIALEDDVSASDHDEVDAAS